MCTQACPGRLAFPCSQRFLNRENVELTVLGSQPLKGTKALSLCRFTHLQTYEHTSCCLIFIKYLSYARCHMDHFLSIVSFKTLSHHVRREGWFIHVPILQTGPRHQEVTCTGPKGIELCEVCIPVCQMIRFIKECNSYLSSDILEPVLVVEISLKGRAMLVLQPPL